MASSAHRNFYDYKFGEENNDIRRKRGHTEKEATTDKSGDLLRTIRESVVGNNYTFKGPYGSRKALYCDYVATGRPVQLIENYINKEVLPAYANTHTTTSVTGLQSTMFRDEARTIIKDCVNASEYDAVIFVGSGATSAVHLLISCMNLGQTTAPIIITGPYDHHSTLLPWRELSPDVIQIRLDGSGVFNMTEFIATLKQYEHSDRKIIGCMSACSNITGHMLPVNEITSLLHQYDGLSFWDYAAAAPYVNLNMNPVSDGSNGLLHKDAMFISPHKFVGGPSTPGILIAKKRLFQNGTPSRCGGGTVFFVRNDNHVYLKDVEQREEGGTPDIIGSIRAGLTFKLKQTVTVKHITDMEIRISSKALSVWRTVPQLVILGDSAAAERGFAVFSFMFKTPDSKRGQGHFLHHNMAASLLNDLFGIQTRGGCACAGPYALHLLGISELLAERFETSLVEDSRLDRVHLRRQENSEREVLRPGFVRLNLPYFISDQQLEFVIEAVKLVAEYGWRLLPDYVFNPATGEWKVRGHTLLDDRKWLSSIDFLAPDANSVDDNSVPSSDYYNKMLKDAREKLIVGAASSTARTDNQVLFEDTRDLLWFLLPSEAADLLNSVQSKTDLETPKQSPVFTPKLYQPNSENGFIDQRVTHLEKQFSDVTLNNDSEPQPELACSEKAAAKNNEVSQPGVEGDGPHLTKRERKKKAGGWRNLPKSIYKPFLKAVRDHGMIRSGDRLLVCLSGGKDSLSLLHAIKQYQHQARSEGVVFNFGAVTVDPGSTSYDPTPLIPYLAGLGIPYFYEQQGIIKQAGSLANGCDSICSFCSRMKRGRIYKCARDNQYNVLALGQHLDDISESFLMSVFHNGLLRTMKANYTVREGDLRVVRPLVYGREKDLRDFSISNFLPVIPENCPACFLQPKERQRVKQLLAAQEVMFPNVYSSILNSLQPLISIRCAKPADSTEACDEQPTNGVNGQCDMLDDL